jgi:hypothetical protein
MNSRKDLAMLLVVLMLLGCKPAQPISAASRADGASGVSTAVSSGAPSASGMDAGSGVRMEYVTDPTLNNMKVMPIQIPAAWQFRGVLVPKKACTDDVSEVFRVTSPDGQSILEAMPRVGWSWGDMQGMTPAEAEACLPIHGPMTGQEFLRTFSAAHQYEYMGDLAVQGQAGPIQTHAGIWTLARANIRFKRGSVTMKGVLQAGLYCRHFAPMRRPSAPGRGLSNPSQPNAGEGATAGHCDAIITYMAAPEAQFAAVQQLWSPQGMGRHKELDDWVAAFSQRYANKTQAETTRFIDESQRQFEMRQQMYKDAAAAQAKENDQFREVQRQGTESSMAHAAEVANSNHRSAMDMVDISLNQQSAIFPDGGMVKVPITNTVDPDRRAHGDGSPW